MPQAACRRQRLAHWVLDGLTLGAFTGLLPAIRRALAKVSKTTARCCARSRMFAGRPQRRFSRMRHTQQAAPDLEPFTTYVALPVGGGIFRIEHCILR
jgi:hypothetical protein